MNDRKYLNNEWKFTEDAETDATVSVRIPHTCKEFPYHYFNESKCQMRCKYERPLFILDEWKGKTLLLTFEGAAHNAEVFINDEPVYEHRCGYTAFTIDITNHVEYGKSNRIRVILDTRESLNIPPFGEHSDFLAYGGIYRDVYLDVKEKMHIQDVYVRTHFPKGRAQAISRVKVANPEPAVQIRQGIRMHGSDNDYTDVGYVSATKGTMAFSMGSIRRWEPDDPVLYDLRTELLAEGKVVDTVVTRVGFREAEFRKDGFYLNGKKIKLRGLCRSQAFPYVGYAMPDSMQIEDANILKNELGVNAVRAANYPQSPAFLNRCDELGLLVICEIPGSRYIGNIKWKNQELQNTKEMILQNRNHPSIILWSIRVGESGEDDDFNRRISGLARKLDPDRATTGVHRKPKEHMVEDVYAYNDFSAGLNGAACRRKSDVVSDMEKPYLISAFGGVSYPAKSGDDEARRLGQALLYSNVLHDVEQHVDVLGSFGWNMTDYNAHQNYGSGDRICYHGVMDMFRNPKLAAAAYQIYRDEVPVLELSSSLSFGENPMHSLGDVYAYTNADVLRTYRDGEPIQEYEVTKGMPVRIDDFVGNCLEAESDFTEEQRKEIRNQLNHKACTGSFMEVREKKGFFGGKKTESVDESTLNRLYEKYILGNTGLVPEYRFDGVKDGRVVSSITRVPMKMHDLEIRVSATELREDKTYDVASVRFRALDENGNILPYANNPLALKAEGSIDLIGPKFITLQGGMGGTYVRTNGKMGMGKLMISGLQNLHGDPKDHRGDGTPYNNLNGGRGYELIFHVE